MQWKYLLSLSSVKTNPNSNSDPKPNPTITQITKIWTLKVFL